MNRIAQLLPEANIMLGVEAGTKKQLFEQIAQLLEQRAQLPRGEVLASLSAREQLGSTGLGQGVAIPHGRLRGLKTALGAFVRPREAIPFDAPDSKPVAQVFALLVPEQATDEHLQLLSELAEMFSEQDFRDRIAAATDATDVHRLFPDWIPEPQ